jgi:hypothetical protein
LVQALLKNAYHDDHIHQAGKRYPVFAERCYQRGHGLSNIFGGLFKAAMPLLKKGVKTLGFKNGIKHCRICRTRKKYRTGSKITKSTGQNLLQKAMDTVGPPAQRAMKGPAKQEKTRRPQTKQPNTSNDILR